MAYEKWSAWQQGSPFFLFDSFIPCYTTKIARRYYVYPARYINGCRISHITSQRFFFSKGKRSTYVFEFDNRKPFEKKNTEGNVCKRICCQQSAAWQKHLKSFSFHFLIFFWDGVHFMIEFELNQKWIPNTGCKWKITKMCYIFTPFGTEQECQMVYELRVIYSLSIMSKK